MTVANLFIVGAPRCGTTSLFEYLAAHPDVFAPVEKEPHFFDRDVLGPGGMTAEAYAALYADATTQRWRLDASTLYLYSREATDSVGRESADARAIVSIRDPVELVSSWHGLLVASGAETITSLREAIAAEPRRRDGRDVPSNAVARLLLYTDVGRYARHVERWRVALGADRVHVLALEDLELRPAETCRALLLALGLEPLDGREFPHVNPARRISAARVLAPLNRPSALRSAARAVVPRTVRRYLWHRLTGALTPYGERAPVDPALREELAELFAAETELLARVRAAAPASLSV